MNDYAEGKDYIYLLSGIDKSFDGITIDNCTIKNLCAKRSDNSNITETEQSIQRDINATSLFYNLLNDDNPGNDSCKIVSRQSCMYIQANDKEKLNAVIITLRLYNTSKLGCYYRIFYNNNNIPETSINTGLENNNSENSIPELILSDKDIQRKQQIEEKINALHIKIKNFREKNTNANTAIYKLIDKMIALFNSSFQVADNNAAFIMRVTILELLINGNAELQYKVARSTATLFGRERQERYQIYDRCIKIYKARSDFLHNGNSDKIDDDLQLWALDYSRRVILELIDLGIKGYAQTNQQLEAFRDRLLYYNFDEEVYYGENPYPCIKKKGVI